MTGRARVVVNALPLDPRGGGVSTYIGALLGPLAAEVDAELVAAVRPAAAARLPEAVVPLVRAEADDHFGARIEDQGRAVGPGPLPPPVAAALRRHLRNDIRFQWCALAPCLLHSQFQSGKACASEGLAG